MVFVWRGAGILVPIFLGLSVWITGYWFEDTRFGNNVYVGWSMLWAGILITLLGLGDLVKNEPNEDGVIEPKSPNDFFWIPMIVWGLVFLGSSIYLINKEPKPGYGDSKTSYSKEINDSDQEDYTSVDLDEVTFNLYNSLPDTTYVAIYDEEGGDELLNEEIPSTYIRYKNFLPGTYHIKMNDGEGPFTIPIPTKVNDRTKYYATWLVLGDGIDLVLIDVTKACRSDINKTELKEINWTKNVYERYDGKDVIEIVLNTKREEAIYTVYKPGIDLPLEVEENETIFALVPVVAGVELQEEYLDSMIVEVCY